LFSEAKAFRGSLAVPLPPTDQRHPFYMHSNSLLLNRPQYIQYGYQLRWSFGFPRTEVDQTGSNGKLYAHTTLNLSINMKFTKRFTDNSPFLEGDVNTNAHTTGEKSIKVTTSLYRRGKDLRVPAA